MGVSQQVDQRHAAAEGLEVAMRWGGKLRGRVVEPTNGAPPYQAFLGIPYAKPPTGKLRFMPPQPAEGWTGVRDAVQEPDLCMQLDYHTKKLTGSEDCLYLNVYRPPGTLPNDKKPVMVYIHFGMWSLSNTTLNEVGPEFFVAKDIVVVVIQYRLLAFGFLCLASPTVPGNMGIKDVVLGLRWVQDNIAAFGGDPAQVTLSGFCVGGQIANLLQFQDDCKGLFHRNINLSGAIGHSWFGFVPADVMRDRSLKLARLLGCNSTNDEEVLAFLQAAPVDQLFARTWEVLEDPAAADRPNPPFMPVMDSAAGPGAALVPEHPIAMMRKHRQHAVPTLFGVARDEGHVFRDYTKFWAGCYTEEKDLPERYPKADRLLPWDLDLPLGSPEREAVAKEIRQLYFGNTKQTPTLHQFYEYISDVTLMKGAIESARHHATHPDKPDTYLYCFSVEGGFNRGRKRHNIVPGLVVHTDDLGYFFGCGATAPGPERPVAPNSIEAVTRRRLVGLLANFIKTGDPTPASDPELGDVGWPPLPPTLGAPYPYLDIGNELSVKYELHGARMRFWQTVYDRHFTTGDTPQARNPVTFND